MLRSVRPRIGSSDSRGDAPFPAVLSQQEVMVCGARFAREIDLPLVEYVRRARHRDLGVSRRRVTLSFAAGTVYSVHNVWLHCPPLG